MELQFRKLEIKKIDTPIFTMSPVELNEYIDFEPKRVYFFSRPRGEMKTGAHCHKEERELFIMAQGSCTAVVDHGNGLEEIPMQAPTSALYVGSYVWHHFKDLSDNAIVLAITSTNYDPTRSDYINDYDEYKRLLALL